MKWTQSYIPTLKETPAEAELKSHQLMLRAGLMRKLSSGIYTLLPLGFRVLKKVIRIVEEEMDRAGAQELLLPVLSPSELWQATGRWSVYGQEMMRLEDRHKRLFALGPTHEEIITDLVRHEIRSYRQLPQNLYQIQVKFRDEVRPRFGIMRAREFVMKDGYSFAADEKSAEEIYGEMYEAYDRIFSRCGFRFRIVEADTGAIGGSFSHEFMVEADSGEEMMVVCGQCDYAANLSRATSADDIPGKDEKPAVLQKVSTPDKRTVEEVTGFLKEKPGKLVKTLLFKTEGRMVAFLIRGDDELNETKASNVLNGGKLEMAGPAEIESATGAPVGFTGPVGLKNVEIIADKKVQCMKNMVAGANEKDAHLKNVNFPRDFKIDRVADIRQVREGEPCPKCKKPLNIKHGIEVGHVFKLGTKYSRSMNAVFLDANGHEKQMVMGCYGIGVSRIIAAAIEQSHDENGIIWHKNIAPFLVHILSVNAGEKDVVSASEELYRKLDSAGVEVLMDDRDETAGVKFKDADLIGLPKRVTIGSKSLKEGKVEIKDRATGNVEKMSMSEAVDCLKAFQSE